MAYDLLSSVLDHLKIMIEPETRLGVFGSVARGDYNANSDIDIVIDTAEENQSIDFMEDLREDITKVFNRSCDITYLSSMRKEDVELDNLSESLGLGINEFSAYKTLLKDVVWCEEVV